ncbi:MAG: hypothetical protein ACYC5Y_14200 [Symbiobacteriia bacterium]
MRRDDWEERHFSPRGEDRYTWDTRHWDERADTRSPDSWEEEERPVWVRTIERAILRVVVLGLAALVLVQLWQHGSFAQWLQFSQFEGKTLTQAQLATAQGGLPATAVGALRLTVTLVNVAAAPEARLLIDGKEAGRFTGASLSVPVAAGSTIAIDPGTDRRSLTFRVTALSDRNRLPRLGTEVTVSGKTVPLGEVR